jgi:hypothetical protein
LTPPEQSQYPNAKSIDKLSPSTFAVSCSWTKQGHNQEICTMITIKVYTTLQYYYIEDPYKSLLQAAIEVNSYDHKADLDS